ncbi:MAG: FAD-dependent oxidoreductase [Chitinophagaceae bacterium]|nr:FAD-dependent oxidoreductase [Chitinophagaceae bacterium]
MRIKKSFFAILIGISLLDKKAFSQSVTKVDICIYGGTSAGVIAAYTAKKMGKSVLLIEPGRHLGGLSSGGLGFTDIGNKFAISGLALDFYRRIGKHYDKFEQWIFEPHVAENLFKEYIQRAKAEVLFSYRLKDIGKTGAVINNIVIENSDKPQSGTDRKIEAKFFLDCSYEGDLMAKAGVAYTVGREANAIYNETYNGVQLRDKHQFLDSIDPYKTRGKPETGLLWGISPENALPQGSGDKKVQAYNFRICLTSDPANQIAITQPENYDPTRYELLLRVLEKEPHRPFNLIMKPDLMPNKKTDINNNGPFSTDMIGMNYDYPESSYDKRAEIQKIHELYIKGFLYFIGHDERVPKHLREEMLKWGYPKDEYADNGNWSPQMYVREARRMIGAYVMTQANCEGREVVTDAVGMAAYTMDSHNCQRIVIEKNGIKMVKNEGDVQVGGFPPYPISFRSLLPKEDQCKNLLVPVCLSASHIAYGSIRMEPVFMVMAQSATIAAVMAINKKTGLHQLDIGELQQNLASNPLADGSLPEVMVDNDSKTVQTTGSWKKEKAGAYGPSMFVDDSKGLGNKSVRFSPSLKNSGNYQVYIYFPKLQNGSSKTSIMIYDGLQNKERVIEASSVKVEGQTSGEWVGLGVYPLKKEGKPFVEISNKNADGIIVADAVLFVPVKKE